MKVLEVKHNDCIACKKCELACSKTFFKEENPELSAIKIIVVNNNLKEIKVCNQCGKCIDVCPTQAIKRNAMGVVMIDKKLCVNCLSCIGFCPTLDMHLNKKTMVPFKCVACGACVKVCEQNVLKVVDKVEAV